MVPWFANYCVLLRVNQQKMYLAALKTKLYDGTRRFTVTVCMKDKGADVLVWVACLTSHTER